LRFFALEGVEGKIVHPMAITGSDRLTKRHVLSITFVPAMIALLFKKSQGKKNIILSFASATAIYQPHLLGYLEGRG